MPEIRRGDVWTVRFDPAEGDEIQKTRPAVVIGAEDAGRMRLQIVVPITGWNPAFEKYFWMTRLTPEITNGLDKLSMADAFQVKSLSIGRFNKKLGVLTPVQVKAIAVAVAFCVGDRT